MKTFSLILILAAAVFSQERFVKPVDDAKLDPSFLAFRTKLIAAVDRKDSKYVLSIVDPNIQNGFGGEDGIVKFRRGWKLESPNSEFWTEFSKVIKNGGSFTGEGRNKMSHFGAPYVFSSWPEDIDIYEHAVIFGSDVNLRRSPEPNGEIVGRLSYNIVKVADSETTADGKPSEWLKVTTLGGQTGYVKSDFIRRSIGYRAGFEKKRGIWKMTYFLAGD
jgi:Bacterial SH3 domain